MRTRSENWKCDRCEREGVAVVIGISPSVAITPDVYWKLCADCSQEFVTFLHAAKNERPDAGVRP